MPVSAEVQEPEEELVEEKAVGPVWIARGPHWGAADPSWARSVGLDPSLYPPYNKR